MYYELNFDNILSLNKSSILDGTDNKVFIIFFHERLYYSEPTNQKATKMEELFKNSKQRVITFFIKDDIDNIQSYSDFYDLMIFREKTNFRWYDMSQKNGMEFMMNLLADTGCK